MQARLRAQLGDRSKYSGERRRRSVVVASIVLTITDPLRGSCPLQYYLQAALIRSCGASFACMELTIISRFQRPQASTKFLLQSLFYSFSVLSAQENLCASAPTAWPTHRSFLRSYWPTKENNMASKFKAVSEKDRCVACGVCVKVCPKGAISIYKGCYSVVDEDICIGCGICEKNCPAGVIHKIPR